MSRNLRAVVIREYDLRIAVARELKVATARRRGCTGEVVDMDRLDAALSLIPRAPSRARGPGRQPAILPCVRCGDPGGPPGSKGCTVPARSDGSPFGFDGELCRKCRSYLDITRRRQIKRREKSEANIVSDPDREKCCVCGVPWGDHTAACANHRLRPGAEPDPSLEGPLLVEGKARTRAAAARRRLSPSTIEGHGGGGGDVPVQAAQDDAH